MEPLYIIRTLFVLVLTLCGYWVGFSDGRGMEFSLLALLLAVFIVALEYATRVLSSKKIVLCAIGAFCGLAFSRLFRDTLPEQLLNQDAANAIFNLLFMYLGVTLALRNADRISLARLRFLAQNPRDNAVLLDTSVIIDGRIQELYEMGFLRQAAIVPTFVLDELQRLSDSRDAAKRHNGRKGLENLEELKDVIQYQLLEKDYPEIQGVDHKLIALAKEMDAVILTNDYNLSKVATIHQVPTLNVNTLAAALRPNLSVGDQLVIAMTREGKDAQQAVGYLEDGTMVVVDDARRYIGRNIPVTIVGMMQTNAGRLVFGRLLEDFEEEASKSNNGGPENRSGSTAAVAIMKNDS